MFFALSVSYPYIIGFTLSVVTLEECHFIDVYRIDVRMVCDRFKSL